MTLPQRSRNDERTEHTTHTARKVKAANSADKRAMRNFDNALRSKDIRSLTAEDGAEDPIWDPYPYHPTDLDDVEYP